MEENKRAFKGIWIPKEVWESKELTLQQKVMLVEIDSLDNDDGCFASNKYFSDFFGISSGRVSQIINNLIEKGYLNVEYQKKDKQILGRIMKIQSPPYPQKVFNILNRGYLENDKGGIKFSKEGYLENDKDNNIYINNISNNIKNYNKKEIALEKFEEFYKEYPKKVSKENVKKWFIKNNPSDELFKTIMSSLKKHKLSDGWSNVKYIPYPSTWLNQKRWEDELNDPNVPEWIDKEPQKEEITKEEEQELKNLLKSFD